MVHRVYLVGGPARVGKSSLAQRLLLSDGIPWFPTDVLRTVLRRVLPELDELDHGNVPATAVSELMYPHIEKAVEVCSEEAEQFLNEGPDIVPSMVPRLSAALPGTTIGACSSEAAKRPAVTGWDESKRVVGARGGRGRGFLRVVYSCLKLAWAAVEHRSVRI